MQGGRWEPREGIELEGKTLALIGCGAIAQAVARIAAGGFGMRVVGYARSPREVPSRDFTAVSTDYVEVARSADFVSLHIPGSPDNAQFMNATRLAALPARAWLINTARGAVLDEAALHDALASRRLAGAALDVFAREPYQPARPDRDLRTLPNVILVPHIGSNTVEANRRMARRARSEHPAGDRRRACGDGSDQSGGALVDVVAGNLEIRNFGAGPRTPTPE